MKVIFVDIDMTICYTPIIDNESDYTQSIPDYKNVNTINTYYDKGYKIVYWTARGAKTGIDWRELTEQQLNDWGCRYHSLRLDKPYYDTIIDDKAIALPLHFDSLSQF